MKRHVTIVDDDNALRDSLGLLLRFRGYDVAEYGSGEDFLGDSNRVRPDCIILDLKMPGINGLDVLERWRSHDGTTPIIVVTAFGDISSAKTALRAGAFDFLEKPIDAEEMVGLLEQAVTKFDEAIAAESERSAVYECLSRLTVRERQILDAVVECRHNREIAADLGLSVRTVEVYKARIMEKMRVSRPAELIRLFTRFALPARSDASR